ncbi:tautomerase family protein [Kitasatospora sp. HPMI-4]|uniref:tautomerase family protein n=1 Tax=Kitasatospora sp. HPMI-4 TaxID=3448443 RepID=UPI003F1BC511
MPLVRITLSSDRPAEQRPRIAAAVHRALVDAVGIPEQDRFQIVQAVPAEQLFFDPEYLGVDRRDVVCVEITLRRGRPEETKRALYRRIAEEAGKAGVRSEDVLVVLTENGSADWSAGRGEAQLLDLEQRMS